MAKCIQRSFEGYKCAQLYAYAIVCVFICRDSCRMYALVVFICREKIDSDNGWFMGKNIVFNI